MNEAPWWFVPLVTFGSVLLAQLVVLYIYFSRQRAEDARRWHEKRWELYGEFLSSHEGLMRQMEDHGSVSTADYRNFCALWGQMRMMSSREVIESGSEMQLNLLQYMSAAERQSPNEEQLKTKAQDSSWFFIVEARKELNIP